MKKKNPADKRKAPRIDYSVPFHYETQGMEYIGFMRNVSIGGAFINTNLWLDTGQEITLNVVLPERGYSRLVGNILRADPHGYGIEFVED
ncbi:MAG: PilZ domain-containing protein [Desulfobacterales bacterium]|nr:MAG: PilZ domain-containing protein [Desulfobacterales bacterium]